MIKSFEDLKENPAIKVPQRLTNQIPWSSEVMLKVGRPSGTPSEIYSWFFREDAKRQKGLKNEIDIAEIKAAAKGVRNRWYKRYHFMPEKFKPVLEGKEYNWSEIMESAP